MILNFSASSINKKKDCDKKNFKKDVNSFWSYPSLKYLKFYHLLRASILDHIKYIICWSYIVHHLLIHVHGFLIIADSWRSYLRNFPSICLVLPTRTACITNTTGNVTQPICCFLDKGQLDASETTNMVVARVESAQKQLWIWLFVSAPYSALPTKLRFASYVHLLIYKEFVNLLTDLIRRSGMMIRNSVDAFYD